MGIVRRYSSLVGAQCTSYRDRVKAVLANALMPDKYLGGFRVIISKNGHLLLIADADSEEDRPRLVTMKVKFCLLRQAPRSSLRKGLLLVIMPCVICR